MPISLLVASIDEQFRETIRENLLNQPALMEPVVNAMRAEIIFDAHIRLIPFVHRPRARPKLRRRSDRRKIYDIIGRRP